MFRRSFKLGKAKLSGTGDVELLDEGMRWFLPNCGVRRTKSLFNLLRPILLKIQAGDAPREITLFSRSFVKDKEGRYELFFSRADDLLYLQKMAEQIGFTVTDIVYGDSKPSGRTITHAAEFTLSVALNGRSIIFDLADIPAGKSDKK